MSFSPVLVPRVAVFSFFRSQETWHCLQARGAKCGLEKLASVITRRTRLAMINKYIMIWVTDAGIRPWDWDAGAHTVLPLAGQLSKNQDPAACVLSSADGDAQSLKQYLYITYTQTYPEFLKPLHTSLQVWTISRCQQMVCGKGKRAITFAT